MASIKQKSNGKWSVRVSYVDPTGKRHFINKSGFKNKTTANQFAVKKEFELQDQTLSDNQPIEFADYFQNWVETYKVGKVRSTSLGVYVRLTRFARKYLPGIMLQKMTRTTYQNFITKLVNNHNLRKSTIACYNTIYHSAIRYAFEDGLIPRDFAARVQIGGRGAKDVKLKYLEYDEMVKLYNATKDYKGPVRVNSSVAFAGLQTGLRFGELAGLTWSAIDFDSKTLSVTQTWHDGGFQPTKTESSVRTISIDDVLIEHLKQIHKSQLTRSIDNPHRLVFLTNRNHPIQEPAFNDALRTICQHLGIKRITPHGLRHTHVSYLLFKGVKLEYVSQRIGHKNTSMTRDVYAHLLQADHDKSDKAAMMALNDLKSAHKSAHVI